MPSTADSAGRTTNAEDIVAAFTGRLRRTIDLDTVRNDLVCVVDETFQPVRVPRRSVPSGPAAKPGG